MSRERILEVVLTILGAVFLLIAAVGKHPYGFYMVLRLVITVGAVYWAWRVYKVGQRAWTWIFVAVALLLNPFLPIHMQRAQWQPIDLCLGILLIAWSGYWLFRGTKDQGSRLLQREGVASPTGEVSPAPRQRLETLSLQLDEVNKKLEERQEKRAWKEAQRAIDRIKEEVAREERKAGRKRTQAELDAEFDGLVKDLDKLLVRRKSPEEEELAQKREELELLQNQVAEQVSAATRAASPRRTSPARGWWTDSTLYSIAWTTVCLLSQLLWGGGFSLAVSAPDTVLGKIIVFALAFGGFAWAAEDSSSGIRKVLAKIGMTTFARQAATTVCLISFTILALNFVGSIAARPSTPETQLITNVSGTSVLSASAGCQPPVFSQQEFSALKQQAASGDAAAQCGVGRMYSLGKGVPEDDAQAVLWFRKAAEQGDAHAQYDLGVLYYEGHGVPQDYAQSARWLRKAAEQGYADAQYNLGVLYYEGENQGVPQDDTQAPFWRRKIRAWRAYINSVDFHNSEHWRYTQAALWFRKAADQGDAEAQDALGDLYDSDQGGLQDYEQAAFWYRKAADQGYADAQWSLGGLYLDGQGVPRDYAEAYFWYDLAAAGEQDASDSKQVAKSRDEAASHLTPADLSREQERARKWFEAHPAKPQ
jgi:TPR repeat protein